MADRITVHGASGGLGVSTLAVALAVGAARAGLVTVVVDGVLHRGGLDVTACVEHLPGLRWPDLARARGVIDGAALLAALPRAEGAAVLAMAMGGVRPGPGVREAAVSGLVKAGDLLVVDGGTTTGDWSVIAGPARSADLLLASTTARGIADAAAAVANWQGPVLPHLLVRGDEALAASLAEHLGTPLLGCWSHEARVRTDERRGLVPGARQGTVRGLAELVLQNLAPQLRAMEGDS